MQKKWIVLTMLIGISLNLSGNAGAQPVVPGFTAEEFATGLVNPRGISIDGAGNIYTVEFTGKVYKISPAGTKTLFVNLGPPPGGFGWIGPHFDRSSGNLFVSDHWGGVVKKIGSDGVVSPFPFASGLGHIGDITSDAAGNIYVGGWAAGVIYQFTSAGSYTGVFATGLNQPDGMVFGSDGALYVGNRGTDQIMWCNPNPTSNAAVAFTSGGLLDPLGVTSDGQGNLYVANFGNGTLSKVNLTTGAVSQFGSGFSGPLGLVFDASGNLFVADYTLGKIFKICEDSPPAPHAGLPWVDVWDSTDPNNYVLIGQIQTIQTAETGKDHYDFYSASGHPSDVNLGTYNSSVWMHEDTGNHDLTFGFIFSKDDGGVSNKNKAEVNFRIVDSAGDPVVSQSDDEGEAKETPAGSNAFRGTFNYNDNTDGIAVSGISGGNWTIIIASVNFGNIAKWFAANGSAPGPGDDLALMLGHEYRLTPAGHQPSGKPVLVQDDTTPPVVTVPADVTVEATGPKTAVVIGTATATDAVGVVSLTSDALAAYPVGTTVVTWKATDASGNSTTGIQKVIVQDTTSPNLTVPGSVTAECQGPAGTSVNIGTATASDVCDPNPVITNNAPSAFPMGETIVTWTATDASGNSTTGIQKVIVQDTTSPNLTVPGSVTADCAGSGGTSVNIGTATASDICDPNPVITNNAPSAFPMGETIVTWKATDASGNSTTGEQKVLVRDTTSPNLTVPGSVTAECQGPAGTSVTIGTATASDICDPNPVITNNAPSAFPMGETIVTWKATDASGNSTSGTQTVTIVDTTPPVVSFNLTTTALWPVNHKMVLVASGISASDVCDADPSVVVSVTSDEAINGIGDGNTDPDWVVINGDLFLRAERDGRGDGRVYTITVVATDKTGNRTTVTGTVDVPHSQGNTTNTASSQSKGKGKKPVVETQSVTPTVFVSEAKVIVGQPSGALITQGESMIVEGSHSSELVTRGDAVVIGGISQASQILIVNENAGLAPSVFEHPVQKHAFTLSQNHPNPFNPETVIGYTLSEASNVQLVIYNLLGQEVRMLVNGSQAAGQYQVRWDGRDALGRQVTSGVYLYRLLSGTDVAVRKMILIK